MASLLDALLGQSSSIARNRGVLDALQNGAAQPPTPGAPSVPAAGPPQPQLAQPSIAPQPMQPPTVQDVRDTVRGVSPIERQGRALVAQRISRVTGGDVPSAALGFIEETVRGENEGDGNTAGSNRNSFLARLFVGDKVPGLSDAQNRRLRQSALLEAGLVLGASPDMSWGQALATGILVARRSAAQTAGALLDEQAVQQRIAERAQVLGGNLSDLEKFQELRRISVREGDLEQTKALGDIITELREADANKLNRTLIDPSQTGGAVLFRDDQGNVFDVDGNKASSEQVQAAITQAQQAAAQAEPQRPVTLSPGDVLVDPDTGETIREIPAAADDAEGAATEAAQERASFITQDIDRIISIVDETAGELAPGAGGAAAITQLFPGSDARRVADLLDTVKSNIGLDRLVEIKSQGATLGALSDREMDVLVDSLGKLSVSQRPEDLKRNLRRIRELFAKAQGDGADVVDANAPANPRGIVTEFRSVLQGES